MNDLIRRHDMRCMLSDEELKPLPCGCGGTPVTLVSEDCFDNRWYQIDCMRCHITTMQCLTEAEAVEAWNQAMGVKDINVPDKNRTAKPERVEMQNPNHIVYRCSECGQYFHRTSWSYPVNYCSRCGLKLDWSENA